jgi:hypothetical protein
MKRAALTAALAISFASGRAHADPPVAPVVMTDPAAPAAAAPADDPPPVEATTRRTRRIIAIVFGSIGVAGLAVGVGHGIGALEDWHSVQNQHLCDAGHVCNPEGVFLTDRAKGLATGSDIVTGASIVVTGISLAIYLTSREPSPGDRPDRAVRIVPSVAPGSAGAVVVGHF